MFTFVLQVIARLVSTRTACFASSVRTGRTTRRRDRWAPTPACSVPAPTWGAPPGQTAWIGSSPPEGPEPPPGHSAEVRHS